MNGSNNEGRFQIRVSCLAVAAAGLATVCLACTLAYLWTLRNLHCGRPPLEQAMAHISGSGAIVTGAAALLLGLVALPVVEMSGGRLMGRKAAIAAIVIPVFASAWILLLPAMAGTRCLAFSMTCGTNLSGLGKAMMLYANDYEDELPRAGGKVNTWTPTLPNWLATNRSAAYGMPTVDAAKGITTVGASLYLLIKHAECSPKMFICKGETCTKEFSLNQITNIPTHVRDIQSCWDFGPEPWRHYSYSYNVPFGGTGLLDTMDPNTPVLADRNPWIAWVGGQPKAFSQFEPDIAPWKGDAGQARSGNSPNHQGDGQSVVYMDMHVDFEKRPFVGIDQDNIYTRWDGADKIRGTPPDMNTPPADKTDAVLINDPAPSSSDRRP
jgi:hypothetical protein